MIKPTINSLNHCNQTSVLTTGLAGIVILAGGKSRRMGTPKAELTLPNGERLLDYHVRQALKLNAANKCVINTSVANTGAPIMIADNGRGFQLDETLLVDAQTPLFHIADYDSPSIVADSETEGPLVAIESALQELAKSNHTDKTEDSSVSWLMVISCDSLVNAYDLWQALGCYPVSTANDKVVVCLTDDTHLYPLLGLYKLTIEPDLKAYIDSGERQVMKFIKPITQAVPVAPEWQSLTNFNTPDDFKLACAALTHF